MLILLAELHLFQLYALAIQAADALDFPALYTQIVAAWNAHAYVLVGALGTGALVALAKQGWLTAWVAAKLPSRYLPYVAMLLGILGTSSAEIIASQPVGKAIFDGVVAAFGAVWGHQALIEGMRKGKELVPPTTKVASAQRLAVDPDLTDPGHGQV